MQGFTIPQSAVAFPQKIDAAENNVDGGGVELLPAGAEPFEVGFQMVGQRRDPVESQQGR